MSDPPINYLFCSMQTPLFPAGVPPSVPERYLSLNYGQIKFDLLSLPSVNKCALLQALRWVGL